MVQTLAIIKPKAFQAKHTGRMIAQIEAAGFSIKALTLTQLAEEEAAAFYAVHAARPFYQALTTYMASGPIVVMILAKEDGVNAFRKLIGATDPQAAAEGTLRRVFGTSIDHNAIHGSDSIATAQQEIQFFFGQKGCCGGGCCATDG